MKAVAWDGVQMFYYNWWGTPEVDGQYYHWDQPVLDATKRTHRPEEGDAGVTHWPQLGLYSSADKRVMAAHCKWMAQAGVGVVIVSWYPRSKADQKADQFAGHQDRLIPPLLDACAAEGLRVAFHVEPYAGRTPASVMGDAEYLLREYGHHTAFYRREGPRGALPLLYVYDSYLSPPQEWAQQLPSNVCYVAGLLVEHAHLQQLVDARFDAAYTYFAAHGFVWGSTPANWAAAGAHFSAHNMWWLPSVGPGYDDRRIRPWNANNHRPRERGDYLERGMRAALDSLPDALTLTSFNEHHESTAFEPCVPRPGYADFAPLAPDAYLNMSAKWALAFRQATATRKKMTA